MSKTARYPDIFLPSRKGKVWFARVVVPLPLRGIVGKSQFVQSTHQTDPAEAFRVSRPMVAAWRARIDEARQGHIDPAQAEIAKLAEAFRQVKGDRLAEADIIFEVVSFVFERLGGLSPQARRDAIAAASQNVPAAIARLPGPVALAAQSVITTVAGIGTPFLAHLKTWREATNLTGRGLAEAEATLNDFATAHPGLTLETLTGGMVQKWIWSLLRRDTRPLLPRSVSRKLAQLQNYWNLLQAGELVPADVKPFHGRKIADCRNGADIAQAERLEFNPDDVAKLLTAAQPDRDLYAAILLAVYSGIRRESICMLTVDSVRTVAGIRVFDVAEKTESGVRLVPVHSVILEFVDKLIAEAKDGYLIHVGKFDQHGANRGGMIGKAFSELKTRLGYDDRYVFHSLRHTFQIAVEEAGAASKVRKNLMGHKVADLTEGRYGRKSPLQKLADAIEKIRFPV